MKRKKGRGKRLETQKARGTKRAQTLACPPRLGCQLQHPWVGSWTPGPCPSEVRALEESECLLDLACSFGSPAHRAPLVQDVRVPVG